MNIQKSETLTLKTIFTKPVAINSTEVWKGIPEKLDPGRMVWALALLIWTKIAFSGQHWTRSSIENCEKVKFGEKVNFSNNQSKNKQILICYSWLQFILLKMSINNHLKWKISTKMVFWKKHSCSRFGALFLFRPKIMT